MNILAAENSGSDPVGAVALLGHADAQELDRFQRLEDGVWERSSLSPSVIECVRIRSARIRGCRFCAAVRVSSASEDGLDESDLTYLDDPAAREALTPEQRAALDLTDRYLLEPRAPSAADARHLASVLGSRGIVEVLVACAVFASADLRIALGENAPPRGSPRVERRPRRTVPQPRIPAWPELSAPIVIPAEIVPFIDDETARLLGGLRDRLWDGQDLSRGLVAASVVRAAQLLGVQIDDPGYEQLVPSAVQEQVPADELSAWLHRTTGLERYAMAFAEQLWVDPSGVDEALTAPLRQVLGTEGLIRSAWRLIWIGQLHRIAAVLVAGRDPSEWSTGLTTTPEASGGRTLR